MGSRSRFLQVVRLLPQLGRVRRSRHRRVHRGRVNQARSSQGKGTRVGCQEDILEGCLAFQVQDSGKASLGKACRSSNGLGRPARGRKCRAEALGSKFLEVFLDKRQVVDPHSLPSRSHNNRHFR